MVCFGSNSKLSNYDERGAHFVKFKARDPTLFEHVVYLLCNRVIRERRKIRERLKLLVIDWIPCLQNQRKQNYRQTLIDFDWFWVQNLEYVTFMQRVLEPFDTVFRLHATESFAGNSLGWWGFNPTQPKLVTGPERIPAAIFLQPKKRAKQRGQESTESGSSSD